MIAFPVLGQKVQINKADNKYDKFEYIDAIEIYERVANKGFVSADVFQKLGNAYYFNAELVKAAYWYAKLINLDQTIDSEYYFRYSQALKAIGEYDNANKMLDKFYKLNGDDSRGKKYDSNKNYLQIIKENSGRYIIENIEIINTKFSDYGSAINDGFLVFTSSRDTVRGFNKIHKWTNEPFTNLYQSKLNNTENIENPELFSKSINSKFNESTPVFTKDGQTMYFTRNNFINGKSGNDNRKIILLKLYKATLMDGSWSKIVELPFNSDQYSIAHPALSPDEKTLYFASDMPGSIGFSDIYKVAIYEKDNYGTPENLGSKINTEGRETFPFITEENDLYFASDGHLGLGGLDVFFISLNENSKASKEVLNVGTPINSKKDDFAFIINTATKVGFFTSNRDGGKGNDDIYKCKEQIPPIIKCEQILEGITTDEDTSLVIPNALVTLLDLEGNVIVEKYTDENGKYHFDVACNKEYILRITGLDGYSSEEKIITTSRMSKTTLLDIKIKKTKTKIEKEVDLATLFGIQDILFDVDKSNITSDAAAKLAIVVEVMKQYPNLKIDVRSHTDCRQSYEYNLALSERRAKATVNWLIHNGIAKRRLTGKGYGESKLLNNCDCEPSNVSLCSEEQHQQNRRSEFIIIEK